jgi:transposase
MDLTDQLEHVRPGRPGHVGRNSDKGNRRFVAAVSWTLRTGAPWRDLPERFGDGKNTQSNVSSTPASTFAPSPPATKRPPAMSSQASTSSAPWLGSNDDRPYGPARATPVTGDK